MIVESEVSSESDDRVPCQSVTSSVPKGFGNSRSIMCCTTARQGELFVERRASPPGRTGETPVPPLIRHAVTFLVDLHVARPGVNGNHRTAPAHFANYTLPRLLDAHLDRRLHRMPQS